MAEATFGDRLMEARRIKGETIEEVSSQLRIRPSIILAMETCNYSHMPHKGYARNMVSSYARYLGLDSTRITEQFLKEFRRWETTSRQPNSNNSNTLNLVSRRGSDIDEPILDSDRKANGREVITAAKRNKYRSTVFGKDTTKETDEAFRRQLRQNKDDQSARVSMASKRAPSKRPVSEASAYSSKKLRPNEYVGKPPRQTMGSSVSKSLSNRPMIVIIGLVALFVGILIFWAILASNCSNAGAAHVPVTGVTAEDDGLSEDQASASLEDLENRTAEDNRYGAFELLIEVAGGPSWLQIDIDGSTPHAEVMEAPWTGSFVVSTSASIEAGAPGNVKIYRNGVEIPIPIVNGLGVLDMEVEQRPIVQNVQDGGSTDATGAADGADAADATD
ncbi:MAG: helix-turn-helix domain-containing protein [Coriobacteriia bacterium]|nr:helix-turn-helix domain-containing protein [Coriobacteriia bacterium]